MFGPARAAIIIAAAVCLRPVGSSGITSAVPNILKRTCDQARRLEPHNCLQGDERSELIVRCKLYCQL